MICEWMQLSCIALEYAKRRNDLVLEVLKVNNGLIYIYSFKELLRDMILKRFKIV